MVEKQGRSFFADRGFPISESSPSALYFRRDGQISRDNAKGSKNNAGVSKSCGRDSKWIFASFPRDIGGDIKSGRDSYKVILSESQLAVFQQGKVRLR